MTSSHWTRPDLPPCDDLMPGQFRLPVAQASLGGPLSADELLEAAADACPAEEDGLS